MKNIKLTEAGKRIRNQRESYKLIRETFAEAVGISPQFLSDIEMGKKGMSAETLAKICSAYNLSADYILFGKKDSDLTCEPIGDMIKSIPPEYMPAFEKLLQAFIEAISINSEYNKEND